jgi:hypothetical protein
LRPRSIVINPGVTAVELDCVMQAEKDLADFLLGPMKRGDIGERIRNVRFAPKSGHRPEESLQTKLQTNYTTQDGIGHHRLASSEEK